MTRTVRIPGDGTIEDRRHVDYGVWVRWVIGGICIGLAFVAGVLRNHENRITTQEQMVSDHKDAQKISDQDVKDRLVRIENQNLRVLELLSTHEMKSRPSR
jgi:hypothetical protein